MILQYNKNLIKNTLGKQGSQQCGVYAVAYGWTILERKCRVSGNPASHQSVANKYNGGVFAICQWGTMGMVSHSASSQRDRYSKIIQQLRKGRPVVVAVQGSSSNHYILVIGIRDGKDASNVQPSDFYIIDPADCGIGYFGSTWAHGFNNSSYGLQYCTFNTSKSANAGGSVGTADHPKSWYTNKYGNEARVYFWMRDLGYGHKGTCAIMGNIAQESNFNTSATSKDGYGSKGLCQWTGGRLTNLKKFAKNNNMEWTTVECQCKFLDKELREGYSKLKVRLVNGSDTLYQLTYDFCFQFERPAKAYANMNNRSNKAKTYYERYKNAYGGEGTTGEGEEGYSETATAVVDMQKRSSQLYSSDNYKWLEQVEKVESEEDRQTREQYSKIKNYLSNIRHTDPIAAATSGAVPDSLISLPQAAQVESEPKVANSTINIAQAMVEAPFVEVDFAGTIIGTYKNSVDDYPNHISRLEIEKVNGEINKYTLELVHQIRAGEDPNLIDKLISKVRYNTIKISYGDYASNTIYGDENAIITNVSMNRDYANSRIAYTIYATSAGELITSHKLNFPAVTARPSDVINELLYRNPETSKLLLQSFPGMRNSSTVYSNNLIPNNDAVLDIDEKLNVNTIEYINYLVGCMSNVSNAANSIIRNSTYYISYENDFNNKLGGAFFKIYEISNKFLNTSSIYEITVGYPDNNYVMGFSVENDIAWSVLFENSNIASEHVYEIDDLGKSEKYYSPNIMNSSSRINEVQKNWWTQMINFPINATLTLKGLMKPIMLMDYMIVNVVFYGQRHITSGVYTITGQKDILSNEGFRTILSLTRVSD